MPTAQITLEEYLETNNIPRDRHLSLKELLNRLGVTANYKGYHYVVLAVEHAVNNPESLILVTKLLYPAIAKGYQTRWQNAERNIRTAVDIAWTANAKFLEYIAQHSLPQKPKSSEFIAILAQYVSQRI